MSQSLREYCLTNNREDLLAEWHPTLNSPLEPTMVSAGSNKKIWWICEKGHEWQARPYKRTSRHSHCPFCCGNKVFPGFNDLTTTHPELASQWHPTLNGSLEPTMISASSNKKIWWICENGHEWQVRPYCRTAGHTGCPYCAGRKVFPGFNDLTTTHPEIAAQWHPTLNVPLEPTMISAGSNKYVWWICEKGHEWQASLSNRTGKHAGCPYCAGKKAFPGFNDLKTKYPALATHWHPIKNGSLTPQDVTAFSNKKVWWQCDQGHEWQALVSMSALRGLRCPICARKIAHTK